MIEILLNFGLGVLGIILYTLFKSIRYINDKNFVFAIMIQENIKAWIWSILVILFLVITIYLEPKVTDVIKTISGIDIENSPQGFFIFGVGINLMIKPASSTKQRKARPKL